MDMTTIGGFLLAVGAVFGGFMFEGGNLSAVVQPTAFIIVVGGTFGALLVQYPMEHVLAAFKDIKYMFSPPHNDLVKLASTIVAFAQKARREGVVALEEDANKSSDAFLKKALGMAVDGSEARVIRDALDIDIQQESEHGERAVKFFEAGGGYSPTVGILGAVLGLIHVMENLADPEKLGAGIAVAFVATVYGVFLANLVFLPISNKLKIRHHETMQRLEMILVGVVGIAEGENPRLIEQKLGSFSGHHSEPKSPAT